ncbi:phosphoribosylamine--glycine ligase [Zavarzinella formosa]|uniref:phosphoribosylamine--glycine ligase n=1 Tax=Zavarzinella formosa TaxID=360055 RepID=UPI000313D369|nr:phosphoribosylamine--glycine ligase [Zavarzinella formosa]
MKVLVIGRGGREHAIVWKLSQSPRVTKVYCAPGNAGTAIDGENVNLDITEFDKLVRFAKKEQIGLTVVGPEEPLTQGLVDAFQKEGLRIFGPNRSAARIEGSKVFSKQLMRHADVPTAEFKIFDHPEPAKYWVDTREYPVVVKADGLAAGKGVIVCNTGEEAKRAIDRVMIHEEFGGKAGRQIVIEKRLEGEELSVLALVSGRAILPLPGSQDHKAALDGDKGPNTGGMGAYCPATKATPELMSKIESEVFVPVVHGMKRARYPFSGLMYAGIMLTNQGPRVLEFNARFGDPETQPLMIRLKSDLLDLLEAVVDEKLGDLTEDQVVWDPRPAVCVVMAAGGYPGKYENGKPIAGLDEAAKLPDVKVFHAGTKREDNRVVTDGGRVLGVTALGDTLADARKRAYEAVAKISFKGAHYRTDIGDKGLKG